MYIYILDKYLSINYRKTLFSLIYPVFKSFEHSH